MAERRKRKEEIRGDRAKNGNDRREDRTLWRKRGLLSRGYFRFDAQVDAREESTAGGVATP